MNKLGPIIVIDDDKDDQEIVQIAYDSIDCKNELIFCDNGEEAYKFLFELKEKPFIILCDINMPRMDGFELRERIYEHSELRDKCIPYLFFSTSSTQSSILTAYSKSIQGFFVKPNSITDLSKMLKSIISYWSECASPDF